MRSRSDSISGAGNPYVDSQNPPRGDRAAGQSARSDPVDVDQCREDSALQRVKFVNMQRSLTLFQVYCWSMPLFDFRCRACDHVFESLVRAASYGDPPTSCPSCASQDLERQLATFAVSSAEKTRAAAAKKTQKAAAIGRQDHMAELREQEHHRREDHGIE